MRRESYVQAAVVVGAGPGRIIRRHVLPNVAPPLVVQAFMTFGFALAYIRLFARELTEPAK